jgi:hypothetical protein
MSVVPGQLDGVGRTGHGDDEFAGSTGGSAGEHGGGADDLVAEHAEDFAEAGRVFSRWRLRTS